MTAPRRPWCPDCGAYLDEGCTASCATADALALLDDVDPLDLDHLEDLLAAPWITVTPRSEYL